MVEELRPLVPPGATLAQLALRWILSFAAVSTVIPGAKTPEQARANAAAAELPALSPETMERVAAIYRRADRARWCTSAGSRYPRRALVRRRLGQTYAVGRTG